MLHLLTFGLLVVFSLVKDTTAVQCGYGYNYYYCAPGQSCGSSYGDCRGLPIYITMTIISVSIFVVSFCIRCCIQIHESPPTATSPSSTTTVGRPAQGTVRTVANNNNNRAPTTVPIHLYREDAPPSYAVATSPNAGQAKF